MAYIKAATLDDVARYGNIPGSNSSMDRRELLRRGLALVGTGAIASILPRYLSIGDEVSLDKSLGYSRILEVIENYNIQRAQDFIIHGDEKAPELIYRLGLEKYLRGSKLEQGLIEAGAVSSSYNSSSPRIAEFLYEALQRLKRNAPIAVAALLAACENKGFVDPSPIPGPNPTPSSNIILGTVRYVNGQGFAPADATVNLVYANGRLVTDASGRAISTQSNGGSYTFEIPHSINLAEVKRVRYTGINGNSTSSFLTTEINIVMVQEAEGIYRISDSLLVGRVDGLIPDFSYKINHSAIPPEGHHKVIDPITYIADVSTDIGDNRNQTKEQRLEVTRQAIQYLHKACTGFDNFIFTERNNPPQGNGNLVIKYGIGTFFANPQPNGYRMVGGLAAIPQVSLSGHTDRAELAATLWFIGSSPDRQPSIANQPSTGWLSEDDMLMLNNVRAVEALGAKRVRLETMIESYEPMV